ncbi:hypothetical protein HZC09_01635 [Candidatus Micrarchaeota archaeon]|nr:hypothetical protein [Candidatus Micrarchaeota archaeon]
MAKRLSKEYRLNPETTEEQLKKIRRLQQNLLLSNDFIRSLLRMERLEDVIEIIERNVGVKKTR